MECRRNMKTYFSIFAVLVILVFGFIFTRNTNNIKPISKPKAAGGFTIAAVGDVACQSEWKISYKECQQQAVSDLIISDTQIKAVLILGDVQYSKSKGGNYSGFDKSFGRFKEMIYPAPGNHDYSDLGFEAYLQYFQNNIRNSPYYSFDLEGWHIVSLDTTSVNGEQLKWLENDLIEYPGRCTLVYGHHPRFSSGTNHGSQISMKPVWEMMTKYRAEVLLAGHEHNYERIFSDGIREFVVGTGGRSIYEFGTPIPQSELRYGDGFGVLKLKLFSDHYGWKFINIEGEIIDQGSGNCL